MNNKKTHTIVLADDHSILRAGLRSILDNQPNLEVISEVSNGLDALKSAVSLKPDLLITDISMPKKNGTDTIFELKKRQPETKAIVLTMHASEKHIHAALNAGADGYILKDDSHKELLAAIENVLNGKIHLSPSICGNVVSGYLNNSGESKPITKSEMLTRREREIGRAHV